MILIPPNFLTPNPPINFHDNHHFMLPLLSISLFSFSLLCFSLYARRRRRHSPPPIIDIVRTISTHDHIASSHDNSLLLEISPETEKSEPPAAGDDECEGKMRKKKRRKKKKGVSDSEMKNDGIGNEKEKEKENDDLVSLYPFTSASSATQRRIKQQYDELVKSHDSNRLTLLQVGQFVNCLIEARTELKHKSEVIHRKFTITKALLFKADKSSFDRLRQQIHKLELEQKRLEEDAFVYNWLQQQLKLSPAYKKMLEVGACMETKAKAIEATEDTDLDMFDISFEELLAREKKDSFWQKKVKKPKCGSG